MNDWIGKIAPKKTTGSSAWALANIAGKNKAELVGERFGRLVVLNESGRTKYGAVIWSCICDCGTVTQATTDKLRKKRTNSCGCLMREQRLKNVRLHHQKIKTHGLGHGNYSPTYKSWLSMRDRAKHYTTNGRYKALGITICQHWDKFEHFLSDMGERPEGTSLDRIDPLGNYEPSNCRWATDKQQNRNKTSTSYIDVKGKKVLSVDFAESHGLSKNQVYAYLKVKRILEERQ